jgi:formylglycine-generating enzyme required for sulfatase activity
VLAELTDADATQAARAQGNSVSQSKDQKLQRLRRLIPSAEPETIADSASPATLPVDFGRYRLLKVLGAGGMGTVYLAHDSQLERDVALKMPQVNGQEGPDALARFYREARAAATIVHPNICPLYDVGEIDGRPYLTMARVEGPSLSEYLTQHPLTQRQSAALVRKLALALHEAHKRGVIHRDLKPSNIMIDKRGEPIIMDFGLARRRVDAQLTTMGAVVGTPGYMAPEQANGDVHNLGPACDIYAVGAILFRLLTGRLPFVGEPFNVLAQVVRQDPPPPSQFCPNLDSALEAICLNAISRKVERRYTSMSELAKALTSYLRTKPAPSKPRPDQPQTLTLNQDENKGSSRKRLAAAAMLFLIVSTSALLAWSRWPGTSGQRRRDVPGNDQAVSGPGEVSGTPPSYMQLDLGDGVKMEFVLIKASTFEMGARPGDTQATNHEKPLHKVTLTRDFYIGKYPVTREQFERFAVEDGYRTDAETEGSGGSGYNADENRLEGRSPAYSWRNPGFRQTGKHPVVNLTWHDAKAFCAWLGQRNNRLCDLPSEAQWEYACRAGTQTRFYTGDEPDSLAGMANVADLALKRKGLKDSKAWEYATFNDGYAFTSPVGSFLANPWGLYDMNGNVWQWCRDNYGADFYAEGDKNDPEGPPSSSFRVMRGGSWRESPRFCRASHRRYYDLHTRVNSCGLRAIAGVEASPD